MVFDLPLFRLEPTRPAQPDLNPGLTADPSAFDQRKSA
jgi:hypothetical protein